VLFGYWWYSRLMHVVPAQSQAASSEAQQSASPASVLPPPQIDSKNLEPPPIAALAPDIRPQSPASEATEKSVAAADSKAPMKEAAAETETETETGTIVSASPVAANDDALVQRRDAELKGDAAAQDLPVAPLASEHGRLVRASRAPTGEDVLIIKANDKSWAEVVDANGYQLLYYPLRPGTVLNLQGQAPFRVFLGNAPAVDLSLNHKRFDHTPFHRQNNTARFTVDDAQVRIRE